MSPVSHCDNMSQNSQLLQVSQFASGQGPCLPCSGWIAARVMGRESKSSLLIMLLVLLAAPSTFEPCYCKRLATAAS